MAGGIEKPLTSEETAEILGIHPKVAAGMVKRGELPAFKVGKFWQYRPSALDAWITGYRLRITVPTVLRNGTRFLKGGSMQARYQFGA